MGEAFDWAAGGDDSNDDSGQIEGISLEEQLLQAGRVALMNRQSTNDDDHMRLYSRTEVAHHQPLPVYPDGTSYSSWQYLTLA